MPRSSPERSKHITGYTDDKINYLWRIHRVLAEDVAAEEARIKAGSRCSTNCDPRGVEARAYIIAHVAVWGVPGFAS